jgi:Cytochrome P460
MYAPQTLIVTGLAVGIVYSLSAVAQQQAPEDGPRYTNGTNLVRPADYREWIFLSSGLGMTYDPPVGTPPAGSPAGPGFGNVFVNPSSYRSFMQTGKWPNGTIFILEGRRSRTEGSINKGGWFQTELAGMEALVKDSRFADGWAFFAFGRQGSIGDTAEPLAGERLARAQCFECHTRNAAVEMSFVQFYPTLLEVARQKGTLKPGF